MPAATKWGWAKDIIKVECPIDELDLDVLLVSLIITSMSTSSGTVIVDKKELTLPKKLVNIISCKNPRCITSIEQGLDQVFLLADEETETYRCKYCEEKYRSSRKKQ